MLITAVIPTRNRPVDLEAAVDSVIAQTRRPDELMIVDQSPGAESKERILALHARSGAGLNLNYVHDPSIAGLVPAKAYAATHARGDVVCFLEDDVVLEPGYVAAIEQGFVDRPDMLGCSGVVTNLPPLAPFYNTLFHLFHRGVFRDRRVGVHGYDAGDALIPSRQLSGGLSAWRREVFAAVPYDLENDLFMLEDIDYSTRAADRYGDRFYINPRARLAHYMSPVNRARLGARQQRKLREYFVFYKKHRAAPGATPAFAWLLVGLLLEAAYQSARAFSLSPLAGYVRGIVDGVRWQLRGSAV